MVETTMILIKLIALVLLCILFGIMIGISLYDKFNEGGQMLKIIKWLKRNPCKECDYYHSANNTCQSKKCTTCGCHPYVNFIDRLFCEPYRRGNSDSKCIDKGDE